MKKILLFFVLISFIFLPLSVNASTESTNSLRLLFQANDFGSNSQINSVNTLDTSLLLNNIYEYSYQPRFLGVYGYINGGFNSGKIYKFQITLNYQQGCGNFNWVSAFANGAVSLYNPGAEITNATYVNATNNSVTIYATAKNMSGNYFDFGYQWNNGLSTNLGYLLDSCPITVSYSNFIITSSADTGQQQVEQNDIIINQNQTIIDQNNQSNQELENLNDSLNNSDTTDASNSANDFFSGFQTDTFGLTSIITAPLNLIRNITSSSCSSVGLPLPYVYKTLNLPCLSSIYQQYFGSFLTIYQTITFGIVAYWVCIRIFNLVKDFKNPDHDEIEVLDL